MEEVTFELKSKSGQFQSHRSDGSAIVVKAGEPRTTSDPEEIARLDAASHAVRRVKAEPEKEG